MSRRVVTAWLALACALLTTTNAWAATAPAPEIRLTDQNGRPFALSRERGKPVVVFFGYTHCPDVCPTILANLKRARDEAGSKAADTVVALITLDPKRDTPSEMKSYVETFDRSFLGLRGSDANLRSVYRAYHVKFSKEAEGPNDYLISHTAFVYYIGRDGRIDSLGLWNDPEPTLRTSLEHIAGSGR